MIAGQCGKGANHQAMRQLSRLGDGDAGWGRSNPVTIKDIKIALMARKRRIETSLKLFQAWAGRSSRVCVA
jgi:hypothetical protein